MEVKSVAVEALLSRTFACSTAQSRIRMIRHQTILTSLLLSLSSVGQTQPDRSWIAASNEYTKMLLTVEFKHHPEAGSRQGLSEYDDKISQPSWADIDQERQETAAVLEKLKAIAGQEQRKAVAEDLKIVLRRVELAFKQEDFERAHEVPFLNASGEIFAGLQFLLDEQTPAARR